MDGEKIRQRMLALRDRAGAEERERWSRAAAAVLSGFAPILAAKTVLAFASFRSEIDTGEIINDILARGQRLCLPLSQVASRGMAVYEINDPETQLRPGYCRIPEPDPALCREVGADEIDAVLVPGSVFDGNGGRMGYGGGFYDRFLAHRASRALRIGLAFFLQLTARVPQASHDQKMDYIVSEKGVIDCKSGRRTGG